MQFLVLDIKEKKLSAEMIMKHRCKVRRNEVKMGEFILGCEEKCNEFLDCFK